MGAIREAKEIFVACVICDKKIRVPEYRKNRKYCSVSCSNKGREGSKYVGGRIQGKNVSRIFLLRKTFGSTSCMVGECNYSRTVDVHRLIEGKDGGKYEIGNMFLICPNHHAEHHRGLITLDKVSDSELRAMATGVESQVSKYLVGNRLDEEPDSKSGAL